MEQLCAGLDVHWYVPENQALQYREVGAKVRPLPDGPPPQLVPARNAVLEDAFDAGKVAVMLDDDLRSIAMVGKHTDTRAERTRVNVPFAVRMVLKAMEASELRLGGVSAASNWMYVRDKKHLVKHGAFIRDFYVVKPSTPRFDPELEYSEDYDFNIQHVTEYGGTLRIDTLLPVFDKLVNRGGLQTVRDDAGITASRQRLEAKWPDFITWPHPKKGGTEVVYRIDGKATT
jgi:hypothetical protein